MSPYRKGISDERIKKVMLNSPGCTEEQISKILGVVHSAFSYRINKSKELKQIFYSLRLKAKKLQEKELRGYLTKEIISARTHSTKSDVAEEAGMNLGSFSNYLEEFKLNRLFNKFHPRPRISQHTLDAVLYSIQSNPNTPKYILLEKYGRNLSNYFKAFSGLKEVFNDYNK